jgi:hypothetical protein
MLTFFDNNRAVHMKIEAIYQALGSFGGKSEYQMSQMNIQAHEVCWSYSLIPVVTACRCIARTEC